MRQAASELLGRAEALGLSVHQRSLIALAFDASDITNWQPNVVPVPLQTRAYATAILGDTRGAGLSGRDVAERVDFRLDFGDALLRQGPEQTYFVGHAALSAQVTDRAGMRTQVRRLADLSQRHDIRVVVPGTAPAITLLGNFVLLETDHPEMGDTVYSEGFLGEEMSDQPDAVARAQEAASRLETIALEPEASYGYFESIAQSLAK